VKKRLLFPTLWEQLFASIKDAILSNQYRPGEELPIEKLAAEYGVSNTPVREALARLASVGLVNIIPNKGAVVAPITESDIQDVWEVRRLLEPYVAALAAERCSKEELEPIMSELQEVLAHPEDFAAYTRVSFEVHALFYKHLSNRLLRELLEKVNIHSIRIRSFVEGSAESERKEIVRQVAREHLAIVEALHRRDAKEAGRLIQEHLEAGERRLLDVLHGRREGTHQAEAIRAAAEK
jgi:DNA-binding GntR family transcriptional regulator